MKIRYLIIVSLILAIITVGAVSASENITDDDLAVEEVIEDSIEITDNSAVEMDDSNQEEIIGEPTNPILDGRGYVSIRSNLVTSDPSSSDNVVWLNNYGYNFDKDFQLYVNDNLVLNKRIGSSSAAINNVELNIIDYGEYRIDVKYDDVVCASKYLFVSKYPLDVDVYPVVISMGPSSNQIIGYGDNVRYEIALPYDATGKLTLTVNGKTYEVGYKNGRGELLVSTEGWNLGENVAVINYSGDSIYDDSTRRVLINLPAKIKYTSAIIEPNCIIMSVGEKESISFVAPSGSSGNVELEIVSMTIPDSFIVNVLVSNGYGSYSLSNLAEGEYQVLINGLVENIPLSQMLYIYIFKNNPLVSVNVPSEIIVGNDVNVLINSPMCSPLFISVDNEPQKIIMMATSEKVTEVISGLSVGTHNVKVFTMEGIVMFSKTFQVTVKKAPTKDVIKLTLSKVKVKKSAKKLVIKATLKINGKAKKGLKVKFKFGKKSYTAKTSSKGVAKITVKKTVLKKLKVGKKLTYKATYGKTVKKVTVKVKK